MAIDLVAINGKVFSPEEAKISVFDRGFLFGDAVYEVTRSYGRVLFQIEAHVARLFKSAELINMDLQMSQQQLIDELYRIYKLVNKDDRYVRVQVTRGEGPIGMSSDLTPQRNWVVYVKDVDVIPAETYKSGVSIVTTERLRNTRRALDPNVKSGNYLNNVLAFQDAMKAKAFESIMVDEDGFVTEGTTSNIFCVRGGEFQNPPKESDILWGITRQILFDISNAEGIVVREKKFTPEELRSADEVFITSSTREVLPVSQVDGRRIPSVATGMTQRLALAYKRFVKEYCSQR